MAEPVLSYQRVTESTRRRPMWVATAMEMQGGVILMGAVPWLLLGLMSTLAAPPRTFGGWLLALVELTMPATVGVWLVICGVWLRGRELAAPIVGAVLVGLVALPFGWQAAMLALQARGLGWLFVLIGLVFCGSVVLFQAILLVGLVQHHVRNQQDRRERLAMIT